MNHNDDCLSLCLSLILGLRSVNYDDTLEIVIDYLKIKPSIDSLSVLQIRNNAYYSYGNAYDIDLNGRYIKTKFFV